MKNQKLKVEVKNYSQKTKKKCYLCNAREMKSNAEERLRTALVRFGKLGIRVLELGCPLFFDMMKDYRFTKENMLIIIGALFYSLGIIVGRNWEKFTRE